MANEERKIRNKEVNLLLAVRRRKENPGDCKQRGGYYQAALSKPYK